MDLNFSSSPAIPRLWSARSGDMPPAAVPVIYPYVHFCAAVLTEKQSRQRVDFPIPIGAFDGNAFQNPLYVFKVGAVNNRLMHVFRNLPLASVYIVVSLVAEMLCGLEVDYITAIFLPREDICQGRLVPFVTVILVEHPVFTRPPPAFFHVESGGWDLLIFQIYGDLVSVLPVQKLFLMNLPYALAGYFCDKIAWLWRVSPGQDASAKAMAVMAGMEDLFSNPLPSFHPKDLLIGIGCGIALRLIVYFKAKNAKKFRHGMEYGSARWGA